MAIIELSPEDLESVRRIIGQSGLRPLLLVVAHVCEEKAESILATWDDKVASQSWVDDAGAVDKLAWYVAN